MLNGKKVSGFDCSHTTGRIPGATAAGTLNEMSRNNMLTGYQTLRTITDTGDIQIIAVAVDSQEVFGELKAPGIDILQVNLPGSPEAI